MTLGYALFGKPGNLDEFIEKAKTDRHNEVDLGVSYKYYWDGAATPWENRDYRITLAIPGTRFVAHKAHVEIHPILGWQNGVWIESVNKEKENILKKLKDSGFNVTQHPENSKRTMNTLDSYLPF